MEFLGHWYLGIYLFIISEWALMFEGLLQLLWIEFKVTGQLKIIMTYPGFYTSDRDFHLGPIVGEKGHNTQYDINENQKENRNRNRSHIRHCSSENKNTINGVNFKRCKNYMESDPDS